MHGLVGTCRPSIDLDYTDCKCRGRTQDIYDAHRY